MRFIKQIFIISLFLYTITHSTSNAFAIHNPLDTPNNRFGIHILFTSEISEAAELVNSSGGDWGYVTIPIQTSDKDIVKWQIFLDQAKKHHLIPILRLATDGDYFNTSVWNKPNDAVVLDFANFLSSLTWPTENKYIIVFNEVNRGDEWGGESNPSEYAKLLSYAVTVFKSKDPSFFIISAGLDNAAENIDGKSMNQYSYFTLMNEAVPGIFSQLDGISSHSYPNPGFSQPPTVLTAKSISSFKYERDHIESMGGKNLPVFITETGWVTNSTNEKQHAEYFKQAFNNVWSDSSIVTVTPFILNAGAGPFVQFSLLKPDSNKTDRYNAIFNLPKTKGKPVLTNIRTVLGKAILSYVLPTKDFSSYEKNKDLNGENKANATRIFLKWLLNIR
ncbi:MAG: hypothetical protein V1697_02605 [Candidatus Levyibacteriota bacterium]